MATERPIVEEVLDFALYAPLGLALTIAEDLPALVNRGRRQIEGQLGVARFVGRMAARQIRNQIDAYLATPEPQRREPPADVSPASAPSVRGESAGAPSSAGLAIEGYDSLAASQVIARLGTLEPDELAAIGSYESATRRRQTILNRIAQLESDIE
jgi:hypothetical protein